MIVGTGFITYCSTDDAMTELVYSTLSLDNLQYDHMRKISEYLKEEVTFKTKHSVRDCKPPPRLHIVIRIITNI